ncbi:hypothetical protein [Paraburkholderia nemoris]|nr:hypothetical protein [Paraburkholderia nemoris]
MTDAFALEKYGMSNALTTIQAFVDIRRDTVRQGLSSIRRVLRQTAAA